MSERRFWLNELPLDSAAYVANEGVPESELKRRIEKINELLNYEIPKSEPELEVMWSEALDILLHGEGEKGERYVPPNGCQYEVTSSRICERGTLGCVVHHNDQSSPTRAEWEEWADEISQIIGAYYEHAMAIKSSLLSMPIVPKE